MMSMNDGDARRHGATRAISQPTTASTGSTEQPEALREKARGLAAFSERNEPKETAPHVKIHMHPAKRRLLLVLALGSVLGCILVTATMRLVVTPLQQWHASPHHDAVAQLERLRMDMARLRDTTVGSTERMKEFLHQMQRVHAASTSRTALVEKAAAQSYREHARDHIREHFMAIKEGILVQTSQRRRIEDAREELLSMGLTADALLQRLDVDTEKIEGLAQQKHSSERYGASFANQTSASSSLAQSIRSIRLAMLEHSLEAQNVTTEEESTPPVSQDAGPMESLTASDSQQITQTAPHEHGVVVYLVVFGLVGLWMWSVVTDERTRKTSTVFHTHRAVWKMLSGIIVVERVDAGGDDFMGVDRR